MASGICIYAEHYNGKLDPVVAELVTAAYGIREITGETVKAVLAAEDCLPLAKELSELGVEEILAVNTGRDLFMQEDALGQVMADLVRELSPSCVLVPATPSGRSVFSRAAVRLGCGMTADCTEILVGTRDDGSFYLKQNKPSFGGNVFVTIVAADGVTPQLLTVRPGVYEPRAKEEGRNACLKFAADLTVPESGIRIVSREAAEISPDRITGAEIVAAGGRGVLEGENFELFTKFAEKIGAAVGGTRPLADEGVIPFENQIGQTGCTIRPRICISAGVSGAVQHTEGIKDTKLFIAINRDENAPIFHVADYGLIGDVKDVFTEFLNG